MHRLEHSVQRRREVVGVAPLHYLDCQTKGSLSALNSWKVHPYVCVFVCVCFFLDKRLMFSLQNKQMFPQRFPESQQPNKSNAKHQDSCVDTDSPFLHKYSCGSKEGESNNSVKQVRRILNQLEGGHDAWETICQPPQNVLA